MMLFLAVSFVMGKRTRDFAFVSLCYGRSGEEMCTGYAMAASGRMQYDYKQTNSNPNNICIDTALTACTEVDIMETDIATIMGEHIENRNIK